MAQVCPIFVYKSSFIFMTQQERIQDIADAFEMFDSWEDRYRFLIDLGKKLPPLPEGARVDSNLVHGCQSSVWMVGERTPENTIEFVADSDSTIVRGLIAILYEVYNGETPESIIAFDIDELLRNLELDQHLSLGRRNGLAGMVSRIRGLAATA
jgi:cysteine desulfuration protein SufE